MAESAKYSPINGGTIISDFSTHFSLFKTKRTKACAFAFFSVFVAFTVFLAFCPSPNSSSPWFTNIFSNETTSSSNGSHFSSIFSYFSPNSFQQQQPSSVIPNGIAGSQNSSLSETGKNQTLYSDKVEPYKPLAQSSSVNATNQQCSSSAKNQTQSHKDGILKANQTQSHKDGILKTNQTQNQGFGDKVGVLNGNHTQSQGFDDKVGVLKENKTQSEGFDDKVGISKENKTQSEGFGDKVGVLKANKTGNGEKIIGEKGVLKNLTSSLAKKKQSNGTSSGVDLVKSLLNCDFFDGNWVKDESYPLYKPGSCSLIDEQFNCFANARPDNDYFKYRWKPKACTLPRLNGAHMLEMLRGKRLVFVGDSLNRNMWESLVCILRNSVKDPKKVYEEFGRHHFKGEASYSFVFKEYKCKVEFFVSPFLVQEWQVGDKKGTKETLRLDLVGQSAEKYKNADIIVFNTGHWWTHEKTSKGKDYYQEGSHVYNDLNVLEAFRKALTTWGRWVDAHINPAKTFVLFRGYSASHFSGGRWNSGGACDHETEPIKNETYLAEYPPKMKVLERVLRGMKTKVSYLNVTRMTDFRKDGHPSIYRKQKYSVEENKKPLVYQDCSHWCLPGVPDAWNEILYAKILVQQHQKQQEKKS